MRVCIASHHAIRPATYNGLIFEAVRALADMTQAQVVAPPETARGRVGELASRVRRKAIGRPLPPARREALGGQVDLFLFVAMCPEDLLALESVQGWRERAGRKAVFLFESWSAQAASDRPFYRLLDGMDHVFLFNPSSVAAVQACTSAPCSYLPAGCDTLLATPWPNPGPRPIDVYGMGRIDAQVHAQLLEMTAAQRLFYLWEPWGANMPRDGFAAARARTYHLIRSSRLFTSFNFKTASSKIQSSRGEEAIPARVFEGAAGGAVLIGTAPPLREFDALFDWPDAFVEIPTDPMDIRGVYEELDRSPERMRRASTLNAAQSLRRHDWAHRLEAMLAVLELPMPVGVTERRARLTALADRAEATLDSLRIVAV